MVERARGPVEVSALRIGRTDVGAATALIDDETLTLVVRVEGEDRPVRVKLASIDNIRRGGDELELVLRDGTCVSIVSAGGSALHDELLDRCRTIPELTRTLRAFGSRRRSGRAARAERDTDAGEQRRFFSPLMDARRAAVHAEGAGAIAAFDAPTLLAALDEALARFAADRHLETGPARRALEAELIDASEPLYDALRALGQTATDAIAATDDLRLWRVWSAQLRSTFEIADRVWMAVDAALDSAARLP